MAELTLKPVPPFRLDLTAWALRRTPVNAMDRWDGSKWGRTLVIDDTPIDVVVAEEGSAERPRVVITAGGGRMTARREEVVVTAVRKMLGLDVDLRKFYRIAERDRRLSKLADECRGLKPPRMPSVFEALVNGIACQQITLVLGITLLNRLTNAFGVAGGAGHAFPTPGELSGARVEDVKSLGFSGRKAEYIIDAARAVDDGRLDLEALAAVDDDTAVDALLGLRGIGRWTAEYVALRGLGRLDIFPADDIGGQSKLKGWLGLEARPGYEGVHEILDRWRPFRGFLYFHLLVDSLLARGLLQPMTPLA